MKYAKSIFCIFLVAVLLSGCSFKLASSVNDLISAISPFGDNANIQQAMNDFLSNDYALKNPSAGEYVSSYTFYDLDNDNIEEAVSFFQPGDNLDTIEMAILKKKEDSWKVVQSINGNGSDVYKIEFKDVDNDGIAEILVLWNAISNSTNHNLSIYGMDSASKEFQLKKLGNDISLNEYIVVDFENDGKNELLVFTVNSNNSFGSKAVLYQIHDSKFKPLSETKLDSHVSTYSNLQIENAENEIRVYADALGSNGESMLTEIIYSSEKYNSIVSPFYSYSTGLTKETSRGMIIPSSDINDDKLIEIPLLKASNDITSKNVKLIDWKNYKKSTLIHSCFSLYVKKDKYFILLPDKLVSSIKANYDDKNNLLKIVDKKSSKEVFCVIPVLKAVYQKEKFDGYAILMEKNGYYYLGKIVANENVSISIDELKNNIKVL